MTTHKATPPPCDIPHLVAGLADLGLGVLIFNEHKRLKFHSDYAAELLSWITSDPVAQVKYDDLLAHFFDLALNDEEVNWADLPLGALAHQSAIFSEVLRGTRGHYVWAQVAPYAERGVMVVLQDARGMIAHAREEHRKSWQHRILLDGLEGSKSGVLLFDPGHERQPVLFANQAACDILGRRRDYILGQNWNYLLPEYNPDRTDRIDITYPDGRTHKIAVQLSVREKLGLLFMADVTLMDQKEGQLRHMQKLDQLGQLAGGVAHDFNNILGVISGYAHLLQGWAKEDERAAPAVTSILNSCARGAALSNKLLAFSRVHVDSSESCILQHVADHLKEMMVPLLPSLIEFSVMMPPTAVGVACSEDHLIQILMNLVINARDAMPNGGLIALQAMVMPDKTVRIIVRDNGVGMPPDVQARIFEPFFTTKEVGKGTGLGLAVVYGLVKQHQGTIEVSSTLGIGTTFTILLPFTKNVGVKSKKASAATASLAGKVVMVVDDEQEHRVALKLFLEEQGLEVLEASDGNAALDFQDGYDGPIDILISDIRMPGLYGDDLAKLWRGVRAETKIVLMSGYTENRPVRKDAVDLFLKKPIDFPGLPRALQTLFVEHPHGGHGTFDPLINQS